MMQGVMLAYYVGSSSVIDSTPDSALITVILLCRIPERAMKTRVGIRYRLKFTDTPKTPRSVLWNAMNVAE